MLMNMKELLKVADEKGFAVPAFNIGRSVIKSCYAAGKRNEEPSHLRDVSRRI